MERHGLDLCERTGKPPHVSAPVPRLQSCVYTILLPLSITVPPVKRYAHPHRHPRPYTKRSRMAFATAAGAVCTWSFS